MIQPINYQALLPNIATTVQQPSGPGLLTRMQNYRANQQQQQQQQQLFSESERVKQEYSQDLQGALSNPNPENFAALIAKYPKQREAFAQSWDLLDDAQKDQDFSKGAQAYTAIMNGRSDLAEEILNDEVQAAKNSNQDTSKLELVRQALQQNPQVAAAQVGLMLSSVDPERWNKMASEYRAAQTAGVDLAGKQASLRKVQAETRKIENELKNQIENQGQLDPEKQFESEQKLRKEYATETKNFADVQEAKRRIDATEDTAAGDLALIFSYMKMLDPGSVVREGEFANAQNAAGISDKIRNMYNKIRTGKRLNPAQRKSFRAQANSLFKAAQQREGEVRKGLERVVKNYQLNPDNVFLFDEQVSDDANQPENAQNNFGVTTPEGQAIIFPNREAAEEFRRAAGI